MPFAVACKGHEGLALAADSRATAEINLANGQRDNTYFDNATKLFGVTGQQYIGMLTWGQSFFGNGHSVRNGTSSGGEDRDGLTRSTRGPVPPPRTRRHGMFLDPAR